MARLTEAQLKPLKNVDLYAVYIGLSGAPLIFKAFVKEFSYGKARLAFSSQSVNDYAWFAADDVDSAIAFFGEARDAYAEKALAEIDAKMMYLKKEALRIAKLLNEDLPSKDSIEYNGPAVRMTPEEIAKAI